MPQGRKKTPFSGKAKRDQLKNKKQTKQKAFIVQNSDDDDGDTKRHINKMNKQPNAKRTNANRYALQFFCDSPEELKLNKELARHEINPVPEKKLEISIEDYFPDDLTFPKRPEWSYKMNSHELEIKEQRYFTEYLNLLEKRDDWNQMSYFELNLETWRQLWRVLEMSDIVLYIVDIRYAALMFPPELYKYVTEVLHKDIIIVLNKIDLAPSSLVVAWQHYFKQTFPKLHIVLFTTLPGYNLRANQNEKSGLKVRRRKGRVRMAAEGAKLLYEACQKIVSDDIDLTSWKTKIQEEMTNEYEDENTVDIGEVVHMDKVDTTYFQHEKYKNGMLTIGCIGQPNVGKSSLMNAIMGKKVVSVSRTPGHTKHFQTIFLTSNVRLCDCPGLVFPSQVPKPIQVLMGSYPIAQLRDPFTTVRFLAERMDLVKLLKLQHPSDDDSWSSIDICDGWAKKRGFLTAKAARFDSYRAANHLLRMSLDGKICLCLYPPNYLDRKAEWEAHPDNKTVQWIQAITSDDEAAAGSSKLLDLSDSESDEEPETKKSGSVESGKSSVDSDGSDNNEEDNKFVAIQQNKFALLGDE